MKTYNGPGMTLAFLMSEYGIMMIGFVGNAKKGCDETGGDLGASWGLWDPDFWPGGFGVTAGATTAVGVCL